MFLTNLQKKVFPMEITKRFYLWMLVLIILPLLISTVINQIQYIKDRETRREKDLSAVAIELQKRMPGSFTEILQNQGALNKPVEEQVKVLNTVLQPIINDICSLQPDMGMGYYSIELDHILAIGPNFDSSMLKNLAHSRPSFIVYKTGQSALTRSNTSIGWKGKPVLNLSSPINYKGKIIGHTWANYKMEDVYKEVQYEVLEYCLTAVLILVAVIFLSWMIFTQFKKNLKLFANAVIEDSVLPEGVFPELKPLLSEVKKHKELKNMNEQLQAEITERRQVEEELKKANKKISNILESITDAFYTLDNNWNYTYMTRAGENIYSRIREIKKGSLVGKNIWEQFPLFVGTNLYHEFHWAVAEQIPLCFEFISPYTKFYYEANVYPSSEGLSVYFRDITNRKQMEESLIYLVSIIENSDNAIFSSDLNGIITTWNPGAQKYYGYSLEEIKGKSTSILFPPEVSFEFSEILTKINQGEYIDHYETLRLRKDGERINVSINIAPIKDSNGKIIGVSSIHEDISIRKQMEKEMDRLVRLNLVGEMAAGIAHEIRNPMTTVRGFLQMLGGKEDNLLNKEYYELMIEELDRANSIISEYLSLARSKPVNLTWKNLNLVVETIFPLIQADAMVRDNYINLELKRIPELLLDEKEIRQLILNLVRNGLEVMPSGECLTIRTYLNESEVILAVQDRGKGIPNDILDKIGTPFFTTKHNGTGLGLATCYSIAARHNASIDFDTGPEGTTFYVRFKIST